jgi:hypothetical protein
LVNFEISRSKQECISLSPNHERFEKDLREKPLKHIYIYTFSLYFDEPIFLFEQVPCFSIMLRGLRLLGAKNHQRESIYDLPRHLKIFNGHLMTYHKGVELLILGGVSKRKKVNL